MSQEEAIEIARAQIDFEPTQVQIRNLPRGIESQRAWIVSLYTGTPVNPQECRIVEIDADSGEVAAIAEC